MQSTFRKIEKFSLSLFCIVNASYIVDPGAERDFKGDGQRFIASKSWDIAEVN